MEPDTVIWTIANIFKRLDAAFVDDTTFKRLEKPGSRYEYIVMSC